MNATRNSHEFFEAKPLVNVLTNDKATVTFGYRIGGYFPGPHLLVSGFDPVADLTYSRLLELPTLSWIRGTLTMVTLNLLDRHDRPDYFTGNTVAPVDDLLFLPYQLDKAHHESAATEGYWTVLHKCADLGMISGRGLPGKA